MSERHPTDPEGRALPDPSWPDTRKAPPGLEPLRRFCNTTNRESGADRIATPDGLDIWLQSEGRAPAHASTDELRRVRTARETFRELAVANHPRSEPSEAAQRLVDLLGHLRFSVTAARDLRLTVAKGNGIDHYLGDLLTIVVTAQTNDTWWRLKTCQNQHCQWLFYDHSNNRSGRWCSMQACGGRHKSAAYRRRHQ